MTPRQVDQHAKSLTRALLNRVSEDLVQVIEARLLSRQAMYGPPMAPTEWFRLKNGKAGLGLIVKVARRLDLQVEIRLGQAEKVQDEGRSGAGGAT